MFRWLGYLIARRSWLLVLVWVVAVGGALAWAMRAQEAPPRDTASFLPADSPYNRAVALIKKAFPKLSARSQVVIMVHRSAGLTAGDRNWLIDTSRRITAETGKPALSLGDDLGLRFASRDGQAAFAVVNLPSNFISSATLASVDQIESIVATDPPAGLTIEITGTAGIGHDFAAHTARALHKTTWVTIVAVLAILILVYRSPVGAVVPLVSIGASVVLAFVMLAILSRHGWDISDMERIFAVVLIFGAGVDYALFWISRYREELQGDCDLASAAVVATRSTGPAILASAATTICGLSTLVVADLVPTSNAGRILASVLTIALLAALTLSPALARLFGRALFWPGDAGGRLSVGNRFIWPALAARVTRRPMPYLLIGTLLLGGLAVRAFTLDRRFDSLSELPPGSSSKRGYEIARDHFSKGELYPNTLLLKFAQKPASDDAFDALSRELTERTIALPGVDDVYSLARPLGQAGESGKGMSGWLLRRTSDLVRTFARRLYLSEDRTVLRLEVLVDHEPFSPEAMALVEKVEHIAENLSATPALADCGISILTQGPTSYVIDVRDVTGKDQMRVMLLATGVIALIVLILIRDWPLTLFMLSATWLTYGATLTLSHLFFVNVLGMGGLDWKVQLVVFVIVVAVGQDYNIFLVARLLQAPADLDRREAVRQAIIKTGPVISNCGLIMAATLGSLCVGGLTLLQQTGFALALGILIDTFFVRPVLIPSFFLATKRRRREDA